MVNFTSENSWEIWYRAPAQTKGVYINCAGVKFFFDVINADLLITRVIIGDIVKANFNLAYDSIFGSLNGRVLQCFAHLSLYETGLVYCSRLRRYNQSDSARYPAGEANTVARFYINVILFVSIIILIDIDTHSYLISAQEMT